jgi:hypothetical protein
MTDDERKEEGAEEAIEDLEAPAAAQEDVAGGARGCLPPSCVKPNSEIVSLCEQPTCKQTAADCERATHDIIVKAY